ncbi:hypothetical protein INQ51_04005 [Maribellus sp. CM-23]|uniref:rolling circle replication-associated protein n=1 Tax=Maribellus sp. CM-23 TaxID=2781026 RepID=UPI001F3DF0D5|nr:hypothetical protein [Maribellus sp. CM-23]MCE4563464.1 hypothetical protein [Maribellus sp. CM-23]
MTISISYRSKVEHNNTIASKFSGSSRYRLEEGELIEKIVKKDNEPNPFESQFEKDNLSLDDVIIDEECKKTYRLNKAKVKRKCHAFGRLEKSKKFLAFYSISFPQGLSDETSYKVFNTWLTRCRSRANLNSYLWVAERQDNGTIHFHLLTNDFMDIRVVNGFMASALKTEKKKGNEALKDVDVGVYNGVDVQRVGKKRNKLISYLAKYVSKNDVEFYRLPWHSSRDVSRLFTSINLDESDKEKILSLLPTDESKYTEPYEKDFIKVTGFRFTPDDKVFEDLDLINEIIYNN